MARITIDSVWRETLAETRAHFAAFATLIAAFVSLPALLFGAALPPTPQFQSFTPGTMPHFPGWFFPVALLLLVLSSIASLTVIAIVADPARPAHETVGKTLVRVLPGVVRYLGALIVLGIAYFIILIPVALVIALIAAASGVTGIQANSASFGPLGLLLLLAIIPLFLWLMARLSPMPGVFAVESAGPITGIRRAWVLSDRSGWRIVALILVASVAVIVVTLVTQALAAALGVAATVAGAHSIGSVLFQVVSAVLNGLVTILLTVALGVIYHQLRVREPA